jgi:branched-chain amino acid transport system permease protein
LALVILALLIIYPNLVDDFYIDLIAKALVLGIFGLSLDIAWGISGILSLGQGAFFGLGAYTYTLFVKNLQLPGSSLLSLALAIVLPAILAGFIAYPAFRRGAHEVYFAIITMAVSLVFAQIAVVWYRFTGGSDGIPNVPSFNFGIRLDEPLKFYYFVLLICVGCYLATRRIVRSPFGRVLEAIKENEERVEFLGYNVTGYKVTIFLISGAFAGLGGSLYASLNGIVFPDLFGLLLSAQVIIWVTIGGRGTLLGAFLGALLVNPIESIVGSVSFRFYLLVMGGLFIFIVISFPQGIMGFLLRRHGVDVGR